MKDLSEYDKYIVNSYGQELFEVNEKCQPIVDRVLRYTENKVTKENVLRPAEPITELPIVRKPKKEPLIQELNKLVDESVESNIDYDLLHD